MKATKDDDNRVREWETGLPSAADLPPLSHSLISEVLARAFCMPSTVAAPSSADVLNASQSTLQLLHNKCSPSFPLPTFDPYEPGVVLGPEEGKDEGRDGFQRRIDDSGHRSAMVSESSRPIAGHWLAETGQERDGGMAKSNLVPEFGQPYHWSAQGHMSSPAGQYGSLGSEQGGFAGLEAGSDSTKGASPDKSRKLADTESEDVDSADGPDGNTARTLKRPRLVWTPQLHKRFVDAVGHLGIRNAVPKTIMQLMNVEGLTRENVASHLQKYRLYLKRMQGLSTEGPSASDPLFASTPLPQNLTPSPHFFSNHMHSKGENGIPGTTFPPPGVHLARSQGALASGMMGPGAAVPGSMQHFVGLEHHPYNSASARMVPRRPPGLGEHRELLVNAHSSQLGSGSPPHRILSLFPPSGL